MRLPEILQSNVISYGEDRNQSEQEERSRRWNVRKGVPLSQTIWWVHNQQFLHQSVPMVSRLFHQWLSHQASVSRWSCICPASSQRCQQHHHVVIYIGPKIDLTNSQPTLTCPLTPLMLSHEIYCDERHFENRPATKRIHPEGFALEFRRVQKSFERG